MIVYPLFVFLDNYLSALVVVGVVLLSIPIALVMKQVSESVFGGVSGDTIGATNEVARAVTLILLAGVLMII